MKINQMSEFLTHMESIRMILMPTELSSWYEDIVEYLDTLSLTLTQTDAIKIKTNLTKLLAEQITQEACDTESSQQRFETLSRIQQSLVNFYNKTLMPRILARTNKEKAAAGDERLVLETLSLKSLKADPILPKKRSPGSPRTRKVAFTDDETAAAPAASSAAASSKRLPAKAPIPLVSGSQIKAPLPLVSGSQSMDVDSYPAGLPGAVTDATEVSAEDLSRLSVHVVRNRSNQITPRHIVLLLDVSGSMGGRMPSWDNFFVDMQAKLLQGNTVDLVVFDTQVRIFKNIQFIGGRRVSYDTSPGVRTTASFFSGGGTNLPLGLHVAYENVVDQLMQRNNKDISVMVISDGASWDKTEFDTNIKKWQLNQHAQTPLFPKDTEVSCPEVLEFMFAIQRNLEHRGLLPRILVQIINAGGQGVNALASMASFFEGSGPVYSVVEDKELILSHSITNLHSVTKTLYPQLSAAVRVRVAAIPGLKFFSPLWLRTSQVYTQGTLPVDGYQLALAAPGETVSSSSEMEVKPLAEYVLDLMSAGKEGEAKQFNQFLAQLTERITQNFLGFGFESLSSQEMDEEAITKRLESLQGLFQGILSTLPTLFVQKMGSRLFSSEFPTIRTAIESYLKANGCEFNGEKWYLPEPEEIPVGYQATKRASIKKLLAECYGETTDYSKLQLFVDDSFIAGHEVGLQLNIVVNKLKELASSIHRDMAFMAKLNEFAMRQLLAEKVPVAAAAQQASLKLEDRNKQFGMQTVAITQSEPLVKVLTTLTTLAQHLPEAARQFYQARPSLASMRDLFSVFNVGANYQGASPDQILSTLLLFNMGGEEKFSELGFVPRLRSILELLAPAGITFAKVTIGEGTEVTSTVWVPLPETFDNYISCSDTYTRRYVPYHEGLCDGATKILVKDTLDGMGISQQQIKQIDIVYLPSVPVELFSPSAIKAIDPEHFYEIRAFWRLFASHALGRLAPVLESGMVEEWRLQLMARPQDNIYAAVHAVTDSLWSAFESDILENGFNAERHYSRLYALASFAHSFSPDYSEFSRFLSYLKILETNEISVRLVGDQFSSDPISQYVTNSVDISIRSVLAYLISPEFPHEQISHSTFQKLLIQLMLKALCYGPSEQNIDPMSYGYAPFEAHQSPTKDPVTQLWNIAVFAMIAQRQRYRALNHIPDDVMHGINAGWAQAIAADIQDIMSLVPAELFNPHVAPEVRKLLTSSYLLERFASECGFSEAIQLFSLLANLRTYATRGFFPIVANLDDMQRISARIDASSSAVADDASTLLTKPRVLDTARHVINLWHMLRFMPQMLSYHPEAMSHWVEKIFNRHLVDRVNQSITPIAKGTMSERNPDTGRFDGNMTRTAYQLPFSLVAAREVLINMRNENKLKPKILGGSVNETRKNLFLTTVKAYLRIRKILAVSSNADERLLGDEEVNLYSRAEREQIINKAMFLYLMLDTKEQDIGWTSALSLVLDESFEFDLLTVFSQAETLAVFREKIAKILSLGMMAFSENHQDQIFTIIKRHLLDSGNDDLVVEGLYYLLRLFGVHFPHIADNRVCEEIAGFNGENRDEKVGLLLSHATSEGDESRALLTLQRSLAAKLGQLVEQRFPEYQQVIQDLVNAHTYTTANLTALAKTPEVIAVADEGDEMVVQLDELEQRINQLHRDYQECLAPLAYYGRTKAKTENPDEVARCEANKAAYTEMYKMLPYLGLYVFKHHPIDIPGNTFVRNTSRLVSDDKMRTIVPRLNGEIGQVYKAIEQSNISAVFKSDFTKYLEALKEDKQLKRRHRKPGDFAKSFAKIVQHFEKAFKDEKNIPERLKNNRELAMDFWRMKINPNDFIVYMIHFLKDMIGQQQATYSAIQNMTRQIAERMQHAVESRHVGEIKKCHALLNRLTQLLHQGDNSFHQFVKTSSQPIKLLRTYCHEHLWHGYRGQEGRERRYALRLLDAGTGVAQWKDEEGSDVNQFDVIAELEQQGLSIEHHSLRCLHEEVKKITFGMQVNLTEEIAQIEALYRRGMVMATSQMHASDRFFSTATRRRPRVEEVSVDDDFVMVDPAEAMLLPDVAETAHDPQRCSIM